MKQCLLLFLLIFSSATQASRFIFHRLTADSGLPSSQVTAILQDKKGYMWIGTTEGLSRYDGHTFLNIRLQYGKSEKIQNNSIHSLYEDATGALWIYSSTGVLSLYNPETGSVFNYTKEWMQQQLRVYGNINCFSASIPGRLFIGTDNGLLEYNYATKSLTRFIQSGSSVSSAPVNCIYQAPDSTLWVGTLSGFSEYNKEKNRFTDHQIRTANTQDRDSGNLNGVHAIHIDRFGFLWIGTGKKGVFRSVDIQDRSIFLPVGQRNLTVYSFLETQSGDFWIGHNKGCTHISKENRVSLRSEQFFNSPEELAPSGESPVHLLTEDKNGTVWLSNGHISRGIYYYQTGNGCMEQLRNLPEDPFSISNNQINCYYIDNTNHLWIAHPNYGVSHCDLNPPLFSYTTTHTLKNNDLSSNQILAIYEDSDSNLWVGTVKGLDRISHTTGRVDKHFSFSPVKTSVSLSGKIISSIGEDADRNLWICYLDAAPDQFSLDKFQKRPYLLHHRLSYETALRHQTGMLADSIGYIWLTACSAGLIKYDPATGKSFFYTQPPLAGGNSRSSLPEMYSLCSDIQGGIWLGTNGKGLRHLDRTTEVFTDYKHIPGDVNSLSSNHILCLYCDSTGLLWIGTNNGLDRYDKQTKQFEHFTTHQGLAGNSIQGILPGEAGVLFIYTNKGLSRMDMQTRQIINYSTSNGLLSDEFMAGAFCKRRSGELVSGSHVGLLSFFPTHITADLGKVPEATRASYKLEDIEGEPTLHFCFTAFNYTYPQAIRYKYKLEGYDTDWKEANARQQTASYRHLSAGNYRFMVKASVNGVNWNEPTIQDVKIAALWYRTGWFTILAFILVSSLLYLFYKKRRHLFVRTIPTEDKTMFTPDINELNPDKSDIEIQDIDKEFISKATKIVLDNLQNPQFDVDAFCSQMAMSRASLFRKLKSSTGCSASSFTRNIRIREAALLLEKQRYTIGEVAVMVGFSDPNYFSRCFKEVYGVTPSDFINIAPDKKEKNGLN